MLKKTIPFFLVSALVLGGCNMNGNNDTGPNNNDTPMQDNGTEQDRDRNWTPNVDDNNRGGMDLDGIDENGNGNGGNNGFINGDNGDNNGVNNGNGAPNDTILDDEMDGNGNNR